MKVLMLGWELPPHNSGGLGVACMNLCRALSRKNLDLDFVVPYRAEYPTAPFRVVCANKLDPLFRFGGGSYESLSVSEKTVKSDNSHELSIREIQKQFCDFVEDYLSKNHPDIVHAHDWLTFEAGIIAKKKFGIPLVLHVHATEYDRSGASEGNRLIHKIEQEALKCADKIFAVSEFTKKIIHEKYHIPLSKISVLYNSLDEEFLSDAYEYDDSEYNYFESLKRDGYTIVSTAGRFTIQKGLKHLMYAAALALAKNPKLFFIFAGDGEERNELIKLAADLGISDHVAFTGFLRGKKLHDIYILTDIFIMSSVSEPFGLTALEAVSRGDMLILSKQSGVAEILKSALCYDFWDEEKLANEIILASKDKNLCHELKENLSEEYKTLSWDKIADLCLSIYDKLII